MDNQPPVAAQNSGKDIKPVNRIQENLLAKSERRVLNWLCAHLPAWVTPDQLTTVGFIGSLMIFAGYVASLAHPVWLWVSVAGYCVNWFGDSLDGSIARYRKTERPDYGYFLDHSIDAFSTMLMMFGLGISPYIRLDVALFALTGYLLLAIHSFLAARVMGDFRLSYLAAGPTEMRLVLIALTIFMYVMGPGPERWNGLAALDIFVGVVGVILMILFVIQTISTAAKLLAPYKHK